MQHDLIGETTLKIRLLYIVRHYQKEKEGERRKKCEWQGLCRFEKHWPQHCYHL